MITCKKQIEEITFGTVEIRKAENGFYGFSRFTKEQTDFYAKRLAGNNIIFEYLSGCAGIRLDFYTDASSVEFGYTVTGLGNRRIHYFDVLVDGNISAHFGSEGEDVTTGVGFCEIPKGIHRVIIYLPVSAKAEISDLKLPDATFVKPYEYKKLYFVLGDSISQGFDCRYPSRCYASKLAFLLDADMLSGAIGGEVFAPDAVLPDIAPDVVTVAYGTNDYIRRINDVSSVFEIQEKMLLNIRKKYPNARIIYISPILRKDVDESKFKEYSKTLFENAKKLGFETVCGADFFPCDKKLFADGYLHPNDEGFDLYTNNLTERIL